MSQGVIAEIERRSAHRFSIRLPLKIISRDGQIPAFTRDLSGSGIYFFVAAEDLDLIGETFDCVVEFPPEVTLSTSRRMHCKGSVVRKEKQVRGDAGIGATIADCEMLDSSELPEEET